MQDRDAAGNIVAGREFDGLGKFVEPGFDRPPQLFEVLDLRRVVEGQTGELVEVGHNAARYRLILGQKSRLGGQKVAAGGAFGAADFQQQRVQLVLHLDGVNHPAIILAGLGYQYHGQGADRDQHQKSRRKQQDLAHRTPPRGRNRYKCLAQRNQFSPGGMVPGRSENVAFGKRFPKWFPGQMGYLPRWLEALNWRIHRPDIARANGYDSRHR